jgi:adenosylhomocysteine nucleosidase
VPAESASDNRLIAVTFALPDESRDFTARLRDARKIRRGSLPVILGGLGEKQIAVCHTGVGAVSCRARVADFLQSHRPEILITSGFAGGLDPALKVGDLVVARNFSDAQLLSKISPQKIAAGVLTTQPQVAQTPADKVALAAQTGATAVDMETAIIAELCAQRGIPMLSLRGISDAAGDELPFAFSVWFDVETQKPRVGALLWELATHPAKIPAFAKFVHGITRTRARLTDALFEVIEKL